MPNIASKMAQHRANIGKHRPKIANISPTYKERKERYRQRLSDRRERVPNPTHTQFMRFQEQRAMPLQVFRHIREALLGSPSLARKKGRDPAQALSNYSSFSL